MSDKTLVDALFEPVFPSLHDWFLRQKELSLIAKQYVEKDQIAALFQQHRKTIKKLDAVSKARRERQV